MPHGRRAAHANEMETSKGFGYEKSILEYYATGHLTFRVDEFTDRSGHPRLKEEPDETFIHRNNESEH